MICVRCVLSVMTFSGTEPSVSNFKLSCFASVCGEIIVRIFEIIAGRLTSICSSVICPASIFEISRILLMSESKYPELDMMFST